MTNQEDSQLKMQEMESQLLTLQLQEELMKEGNWRLQVLSRLDRIAKALEDSLPQEEGVE